ncbi:MAG TPA: ankyrin repeat domain-containing protein [Spirochaetota bacterium]|nr:ankyrin repeat domain-containing protein [Spirochaetota bacterium]
MKLGRIIFILITVLSLTALYAYTDKERHDAICDGSLETVKRMFSSKYEIDKKTGSIYPLAMASYCYGGNAKKVEYFLDKGAEVNHPDEKGYNALMWALRSVRKPLESNSMRKQAIRMINMGTDVTHQDQSTGRTALMLAADLGDREIVNMLLSRGASKTPRTKGDWCISGNYNVQCSAADYARLGGHVDLALELDGQSSNYYKTQLNYAIKSGNTSRALSLISNSSNVNEKETLSNLTPLHYAVEANNVEIVRALLSAGADPNVQNFAGITPLRDAIVYYKKNIAKALVDGGAKAGNAQSQGCGGGLTEFGWAVSYSQQEIAEYMINNGAIDIENPGTAFVSLYGRNKWDIDLARLLISKGAKPTQADIDRLQKIKDNNTWLKNTDDIIAVLKKAVSENGGENYPPAPENYMSVRSSMNGKGKQTDELILNSKKGKIDATTSRDPY